MAAIKRRKCGGYGNSGNDTNHRIRRCRIYNVNQGTNRKTWCICFPGPFLFLFGQAKRKEEEEENYIDLFFVLPVWYIKNPFLNEKGFKYIS